MCGTLRKDAGRALRGVCGCLVCKLSDHGLLAFVLDGNGSAAFCHSPQEITVRCMRCVSDPVLFVDRETAAGGSAFYRVWAHTAVASLAYLSLKAYAGVCLRVCVYVLSGNLIRRLYFIFTGKNRMVSGACFGDARYRGNRRGTV